MAAKVGVISDTHGLLRPQVLKTLRTCDCILHGGDIDKPEVLNVLQAIAPLYVVRGNNDKAWAEEIPHDLSFSIEGVRFCMVHDLKEAPEDLDGVDVIVYGHSHRYAQRQMDGRLWLNPGSCGRPRFGGEVSMALIRIDQGDYAVEKVVLSRVIYCAGK